MEITPQNLLGPRVIDKDGRKSTDIADCTDYVSKSVKSAKSVDVTVFVGCLRFAGLVAAEGRA
jgi:hypothetical protein